MTRSTLRLPCELIFTVVLVSIVFYSLTAEAILLGHSTGAQNGPDSPIVHAVEGLAELGTTYTTTSPGTWRCVLDSGSSPFYTAENVSLPNETLPDGSMEFDRPIQFDDADEAVTDPAVPWTGFANVHNQHDFMDDNVDRSIMEEPSPVQAVFDDFERQQQDAMMSTTEPSSFEYPLHPETIDSELFPSTFDDSIRKSASPLPSSLMEYTGSVDGMRLSPESNDETVLAPHNQTGSISQRYFSDLFNLGDRLDIDVGLKRAMDIVETRFEGEDSPYQSHPYPTSIPQDAIANPDSTPSTPVNPSGKKVYSYYCPVHEMMFNKKEHTIEHFQVFHRRSDVTMTNAHPCTHPDCMRSFRHPKDLIKHRPKHTGQKNFDCVCGKTYTRSDNLRRHQNGTPTSRPCDDYRRLHHRA